VRTGATQSRPVTVGSFDAIGDIFANWNQMCAGAILAGLPGVIFLFLAQKYLISGLTQGALKS